MLLLVLPGERLSPACGVIRDAMHGQFTGSAWSGEPLGPMDPQDAYLKKASGVADASVVKLVQAAAAVRRLAALN